MSQFEQFSQSWEFRTSYKWLFVAQTFEILLILAFLLKQHYVVVRSPELILNLVFLVWCQGFCRLRLYPSFCCLVTSPDQYHPWWFWKTGQGWALKFSLEQDIKTSRIVLSLIRYITNWVHSVRRLKPDLFAIWCKCFAKVSFVDILADLYLLDLFLFMPVAAHWTLINPFLVVLWVEP